MRLEPYPWQTAVWSDLAAAVKSNILPHALLFSGVRGLGKRDFARAFAAFLLCANPGAIACGKCAACRQCAVDSNPNILYLQPKKDKKIIDVAAVREAQLWLAQTAHAQDYKVLLLDAADQLNVSSFNALLKTLEEPPGKTCLLLLNHQSQALPATIISRVQAYNMTLTDPSAALAWLSEQLPEVDYDISMALALRDYAPLRLLQEDIVEQLALRQRLLKTLLSLSAAEIDIVALSERMLKLDLLLIINFWQSLLCDCLCIKMHATTQLLHIDLQEQLLLLVQDLPLDFLRDFMRSLQQAYVALNSAAHPNKALLLQDLLIQWSERCANAAFLTA